MMTVKTRLHTYNPFDSAEVRDWKGREIVNNFLYHCIDFEGETYLVQKCEIGDFYSHFERYNDDTDKWHIDGLEVPDSDLEEHVADMWGDALYGRHYDKE